MGRTDPLSELLARQPVAILDGGLATELERRGFDLGDHLWSARLLVDEPEAILQVHLDYLNAGADCITTASYQASLEGFSGRGLGLAEGTAAIERSVELAMRARKLFWRDPSRREYRMAPLVAASIGPYGAVLADGSEYRGDYDLGEQELYRFHAPRWEILRESGADLLACETIPSQAEARALKRLLEESPAVNAWFSFCCRDASHLADGSEVASVLRELRHTPGLVAIGINCVPPRIVSGFLSIAQRVWEGPVVVYPNSGELWNAQERSWDNGDADRANDIARLSREWVQLGARLLGGCCRTTPELVTELRRQLIEGYSSVAGAAGSDTQDR